MFSFRLSTLATSARQNPAPEIRTGLLTLGLPGLPMRGCLGRRFSADDLHPYHRDVSPKMVRARHELGQRVNVWTVDAPEDLRRMQVCGVDMVICNDPSCPPRPGGLR